MQYDACHERTFVGLDRSAAEVRVNSVPLMKRSETAFSNKLERPFMRIKSYKQHLTLHMSYVSTITALN